MNETPFEPTSFGIEFRPVIESFFSKSKVKPRKERITQLVKSLESIAEFWHNKAMGVADELAEKQLRNRMEKQRSELTSKYEKEIAELRNECCEEFEGYAMAEQESARQLRDAANAAIKAGMPDAAQKMLEKSVWHAEQRTLFAEVARKYGSNVHMSHWWEDSL